MSCRHWLVFLLCGMAVFVEGFDTQAIGYVAPVLGKAWHLRRGALGPVFAIGLIGQAIGAFLLAPLADRFGNRTLLICGTAALAVLTLATAFCTDFGQLCLVRTAAGLSLGAALPNAISLAAGYSPQGARTTAISLLMCGFPLGAAACGPVATALMAALGWPSVFIAGGFMTGLLAPCLALLLPASPDFLASRLGGPELKQKRMAPIDPAIDPAGLLHFNEYASGAALRPRYVRHVGRLFGNGGTRRTVLLWIVFFVNLLDVYMLANWLPTEIHEAGLSLRVAALATSTLLIAGVLGAFTLGPLVDRFGASRVLPISYLIGAACIAMIGFAGSSISWTITAAFGAGLAITGGQSCNNGVAARSYPQALRTIGVGWANGIGRIGAAVGPSIAGVMLSLDADIRVILLTSAVPAVIVALTYLAMPAAEAE